jgi:glycolate oxidase FAD binding subunit
MTSPEEGIAELRKEFPVVLERAPLDLRRRVPTFGVRGAEYQTMRRLKQAFDPAGRFNPGRHVDGEPGP